MKMYKTNKRDEIKEVEVTKRTTNRVTYSEETKYLGMQATRITTEATNSKWHSWHDTKEEAKHYLFDLHNNKIASLNSMIESYKDYIKRVVLL